MEAKNMGCCDTKGADKGACSNKSRCSPCLLVWGTLLLVMILSYFIR